MSIFNKHTLAPGVLASLTEPTPDLQRNYRQREMIDGYGEVQENGRYKYSLFDLVGFWICDRLAQRGLAIDRRDGYRIGYSISGNVINHFLHSRHGIQPRSYRYAAAMFDDGSKDKATSGAEAFTCNELSELEGFLFDRCEIIDLHHLANNIPEKIQALLIAADENEMEDIGVSALSDGLSD